MQSLGERPLPGTTRDLVQVLDEIVPRASVDDVDALATEAGRLDLARQAGRREIVDMLMYRIQSQQEEAL